MRLQRASRLALYAVLELAGAPGRQLSAAEIAEKYGVSINYLAKVMRELGRAGLVESVRVPVGASEPQARFDESDAGAD